jgi:hypothetical protein
MDPGLRRDDGNLNAQSTQREIQMDPGLRRDDGNLNAQSTKPATTNTASSARSRWITTRAA